MHFKLLSAVGVLALVMTFAACGDDDGPAGQGGVTDGCSVLRDSEVADILPVDVTRKSPAKGTLDNVTKCVWEIGDQSGLTLAVRAPDLALFNNQTRSTFRDATVDDARARLQINLQPSKSLRSGVIWAIDERYMIVLSVSASSESEAMLVDQLETAAERVHERLPR